MRKNLLASVTGTGSSRAMPRTRLGPVMPDAVHHDR